MTKNLDPNRRQALAVTAGVAAAALGGPSVAIARPRLVRRVLWAANVRTKPFAERVREASRAGFTHMSVFPIDFRGWTEQGLTPAQMRSTLRAANVKVLAIDPFVQWVPDFAIPSAYPAQNRGFIDFSEAEIFRIAGELEAEAVNCVEGLGQRYEPQVLVDRFGSFADRADARGLRVTLEFMPISSIAGLKEGWEIVKGADRANAGLCFDTWHYFRSTPDAALLATIPGAKIFEVQLADALIRQQGNDMIDDLLRFRRLPGDGEMDIAGITLILKAKGAWRSVGPEVFADAMDALTTARAASQCGAALRRWDRAR